jgi:ribosome biogenesis GTPase / thiamine phosphate phosphatase
VTTTLESLGWTEQLTSDFEPHLAAGLVPGRVAVQHRSQYEVLCEAGELRTDVAGRLLHDAPSEADLPVVGDWVAVAPRPAEGAGTIHAVLPRRTRISRKTPWLATNEQVLAANVDTVLLTTSLNDDLNLRRLERYLATAWDSGAEPVIVLTKADLHPDPRAAAAEVESIAFGVPVLVVSVRTGEGLDEVAGIVRPGRTLVLLGSSGVGKSTLVNTLAGEELLATNEIRDDGRGRHTTSHRQLVVLPSGGLVVDTPGLRELQLWEVGQGVDHSFEDVTELFAHCRFNDCAHDREPGCAVRAALEDGTLDPVRWESYQKLQRELEHLERRLDKRAQSEARRVWAKRGAEGREAMRLKGRR